jgi:hypothetical protein
MVCISIVPLRESDISCCGLHACVQRYVLHRTPLESMVDFDPLLSGKSNREVHHG